MIRALVAGFLLVLPLAAADFWVEKKFHEWSDRQVKRMLEDSPWARPVSVRADSGGASRRSGMDMSDASSPSKRSRGAGGSQPPEAPAPVMVVVRWHSALPIRQAVARARYGEEAATSAEAAKMLNREEDRYVVGVIGIPGRSLRGNADQLKERIQVRLKNKPAIIPEEVKIDRSQQNRVSLYCFFAKGRNGSPVIEPADGEVEFVLELPDNKIVRRFRLKEMVYGGRLEI